MVRPVCLDDICFEVEKRPVFVQFDTQEGTKLRKVPEKEAIVNLRNQRVLGIVGRDYRLVDNRQALEWAFECCRHVFPETSPAEWRVSNICSPSTYSFCCIDLEHRSTVLDFTDEPAASRPEAFGPFIRVTNSYNRMRALAFDIGFLRKVCRNGLIAPTSIISFKFHHDKRTLGDAIHFNVNLDALKAAKESFLESVRVLRGVEVPRESFDPLVRAVLRIRRPKGIQPDSKEDAAWKSLDTRIAELCQRYLDQLGENAYAALNAMTELASYPPENRWLRRDRHSLQRLAGSWMVAFTRECREPRFSLPAYVKQIEQASDAGADRSAR